MVLNNTHFIGIWIVLVGCSVATLNSQEFEPSEHYSNSNSYEACGIGTARLFDRFRCKPKTELLQRILPSGDLAPRYPYQAAQFYYYRRPYNYQNVRRALPSVQFAENYQQIVTQLENSIVGPALNGQNLEIIHRDKYLEFSDWKKHYSARMSWNSESNQHSVSAKSASPTPESLEQLAPRQPFGN